MNEREQLLEALQQGRRQLEVAVKAVPEEAWSQGVYENGWNAKQLLCHLAGGSPAGFILDMASAPRGEGNGADMSSFDIDAWNKRVVESKEDKSVDELLKEIQAEFAKDELRVREAPEELLTRPYKAPWGAEGSVAGVIIESIHGHITAHVADLRAATAS